MQDKVSYIGSNIYVEENPGLYLEKLIALLFTHTFD